MMEVLNSPEYQPGDIKYNMYKDQFYEAEEFDSFVNGVVETAVMILDFEEIISTEIKEKRPTEIQMEPVITTSQISEAACEGYNVEEDFTVLPPKKQRIAALKSLNSKTKKSNKKSKLKKPKKWQTIDNSEIGINLTLFPRPVKSTEFEGDIDNLLSEIETEYNNFDIRSRNFQNILDCEGNPSACRSLRRDRHQRIQKAQKQVKTKYCRSVKNNKGRKKLFINHRVFRRMKLDTERTMLNYPQSKSQKCAKVDEVGTTKSSDSRSTWQKANNRAPVQNLAYALDTSNHGGDFEANVLSLLINLQHRELTPEDYEILSILDQSVAPKTVSQNQIDSFKTEEVGDALLGKLCSVCLELYTLGQKCKYLPCGHEFHSGCIDMWLSNSSMNCPLDGLPVDD